MLKRICLMTVSLVMLISASAADRAKIVKVLPHHLDLEGRHSLSPSLYERDAYQDFLRQNPEKRSGLRYDIQWKAKGVREPLLRLEARTSNAKTGKPLVVQQQVKPSRLWSRWSALKFEGPEYKQMGEVIAWRVSLWSGDQLLAEQKSFLW
jgi:hypothetical protein